MEELKEQVAAPQPQPQPQPQQARSMPPVPATIPGIQNTYNYFAVGPNGQLYAYDVNLGQWGFAQGAHMEQLLAASGVPPQTLNAIKQVLGGR